MTDFLTHLKNCLAQGKISLNKSITGDWLSLLNYEQLNELTSLIENLPNIIGGIEHIGLLMYNLCVLEGIDLYELYKDDLAQAVQEFSVMVHLEILQRQHYIKVCNGIAFRYDQEVELLKDPKELQKLFTSH
ncbi:MAG: hypothetical protein HYR87_10105 [Thaumarchaeota archaeon]|nr:hypothetical protein [Nitrososphaerota archaeon]